MSVRVVKVGGRPLGDAAWLSRFAAEVSRSGDELVIVHGGGPEVDELSTRLGIAVERVGGRRLTSPAALDVAGMVLSGRINKRVVSAFLGAGVDAVGLSGEDGGLVVAREVDGGALGRVGEVVGVRADLIRGLVALGLTPVISPISRGTDGGSLNVNADDVATSIAAALGAEELLFLTDVPAVHDGSAPRAALGADEAIALIDAGVIRDGMAVKVSAALRALEAGVSSVRIGTFEALTENTQGTRLFREMEAVA